MYVTLAVAETSTGGLGKTMTIHISVVGIFFGATLKLSGAQRVTDVLLNAKQQAASGAIPNVRKFEYEITAAPRVAITSFYVDYTGPFKGRGVEFDYSLGEYYLAEDIMKAPSYNVWQYYVHDAEKKPVVRGVKFLDDSAATVPEGGTLTWRLVSILKGPNPRPRLMASRQM